MLKDTTRAQNKFYALIDTHVKTLPALRIFSMRFVDPHVKRRVSHSISYTTAIMIIFEASWGFPIITILPLSPIEYHCEIMIESCYIPIPHELLLTPRTAATLELMFDMIAQNYIEFTPGCHFTKGYTRLN